jgi:hypothetical protein
MKNTDIALIGYAPCQPALQSREDLRIFLRAPATVKNLLKPTPDVQGTRPR